MEDRPEGLTRKGIYRAATTIKISTVFDKPPNQFECFEVGIFTIFDKIGGS
jgi:hypothetical protein